MNVIKALSEATQALVGGTPEQQREAHRQQRASQLSHAIVSTKHELPRNELEFGARWITHTPTGSLYWTLPIGTEPSYAGNVEHFFFAKDGTPVLLEPADPPSLAEIEKRRARRETRRLEREAAIRERRRQVIEGGQAR